MWDRLDVAFRTSSTGRWFATLQPNERTMVAALFAFLVVVGLYLVAWRPLADWSEQADARYQRQLAVLDWMKLHEKEARAAGAKSDASHESGSLLTTVANSAARSGIQLLRYQQEGGGGVSVVLQNQPFNSLVAWIATLEQDSHVTVRQISIDSEGQAGLVNARIVLI